jgi:hypothetical protein
MSLSFKEFSAVYEAQMASEAPLTEAQLQEIFGAFFGSKAADAAKASKAAMDFKARKAERDKKLAATTTQKQASNKQDEIDDEDNEHAFGFGNQKPAMKKVSALDTKPFNQLKAGERRALDRNPFGESVKR